MMVDTHLYKRHPQGCVWHTQSTWMVGTMELFDLVGGTVELAGTLLT